MPRKVKGSKAWPILEQLLKSDVLGSHVAPRSMKDWWLFIAHTAIHEAEDK